MNIKNEAMAKGVIKTLGFCKEEATAYLDRLSRNMDEQVLAYISEQKQKIKTINQWFVFVNHIYQFSDKLISTRTVYKWMELSKKDNLIVFDNAGGMLFEISEINKEGIGYFLKTPDLLKHLYCYRTDKQDVIVAFPITPNNYFLFLKEQLHLYQELPDIMFPELVIDEKETAEKNRNL
jgi:hypothetical protein